MKKVSLIVVTGYLGAGKTTQVRKWLPELDTKGKRGLLIINEVGEVNVDGAALGDSALEQRELLGGCACCSLRGDLYNALIEGIENYRPDYILLETSGLAEPSELLDAATAPKLRALLEVTDVVTVVDSVNLARQLKRGQLARMQAAFASAIILNKRDLASESEFQSARIQLKEIAPQASVFDESASVFDILKRSIGFLDGSPPEVWAFPEADHHHHHDHHHHDLHHHDDHNHHDGHHHNHDHHHHDGHHHHTHHAGFFALNIDLPSTVTEEDLKDCLRSIPSKAYRVKGFANVIGHDRPWIFQRVGDLPPQATPFALEGVNVPIGMVAIGAGLAEADLVDAIAPIGGVVRAVTS